MIVHVSESASTMTSPLSDAPGGTGPAGDAASPREPFLVALGERVRMLRNRQGMTRKLLSQHAGVSERHLANLELGVGNASILILRQVAQALSCSLVELLGDETTASPEWLLIRDLLAGRSGAELQRAHAALAPLFGAAPAVATQRGRRLALIGLRGAGKSTLGLRVAQEFGLPFVELNREIERVAGCSLSEIHSLYGPSAYRRYERRALQEAIDRYPQAVIATPDGMVSDPSTFGLLLRHCYTVWLQASPEEHMLRVLSQDDRRAEPSHEGDAEAMDDLRRTLAGYAAFYRKADLRFDTSGLSLPEAQAGLGAALRTARVVVD